MKHLAAHLHPVVKKDGLHLSHHRTFRPIVNVTPVVGILSVAGPLVGDAYAAGEADAPVHYQELSVRAVVHPREVIPAQADGIARSQRQPLACCRAAIAPF